MISVQVFRIPMAAPDDVSGLEALLADGRLAAEDIVAVLAKTEGNGCVNDFTRGYSALAYQVMLSAELGISREEVARRIAFVMSGGTEGVLSPHATVFARNQQPDGKPGVKRLSIGVAHTRDFAPEELGRMAQVREVARAVKAAIAEAEIVSTADVHFVQIKCPLLTAERVGEAQRRGQTVATMDTYESMGYSRGASALGVALAQGEVAETALSDGVVCKDWDLHSQVASTSAGVEIMNCEIIVMGNAPTSLSPFLIGHGVMADAIDGDGVREALRRAGLSVNGVLDEAQRARLVNVFAKAEAAPGGYVRRRRHTMLDDSDINNTRQARAVVGAVVASIVGDPMVYVSGGAEHQGLAGGGPVAVIARV